MVAMADLSARGRPVSNDLLHVVNETSKPRVVVIGDLILDHYIKGDVSRISPEAPIPVLAIKEEEHKLGGAANVAANIVSMGGQVKLIGAIGKDEAGRAFKKIVRSMRGLSMQAVELEDRPTIIKTRMVAQHQQMLRVDAERVSPMPKSADKALKAALTDALKDADLLIISDYGKGVMSDALTKHVIKLGRKARVPVLVDPKGRDYSKYAGATAVTPNRGEAEAATGISLSDDAAVRKAADWLSENLQLDFALITLGAGGVAVQPKGEKLTRIPTVARSVFDVTGAGDTFIATLGTFLAAGVDPVNAARLANMAAGVKVGKFGAAAITRDELRRSLIADQEAYDHQAKIVSRADLKKICESLRAEGRRIVFTNGCFDILHAGHVTYLNFCKQQGDVLVLGLNSDASVRRQNKGPERPINHEEDRARVLSAMADVDFVCIFGEDKPIGLIKAVRPDVLVKGADWKGRGGVVGADIVEAYGGQVAYAPVLKGRSTTNIVDKLKG